MTTKPLDNQNQLGLIPHSIAPSLPEAPTGSVIPWPPPPESSAPAEPLTTRSIQQQKDRVPVVTKVFKTTLGINLGNNTIIPIDLRTEQQEKYQGILDTASEQLKEELTCYLAVTDKHGKWRQAEEHVTWFRYHATERSIEYQIHNEETRYHVSLKEFKVSEDFSQEQLTRLMDAASKLEKALTEITGITIKHITYHEGSVTLFGGPRPFDKSTTPALKSLADKSFEQALDVVKQRLTRKDAATTVQGNFRALKGSLEREKAANINNAAVTQVLEGLIQELDAMDGFAVGIAASSQLKPKDYEAALKLNQEIYKSVCDQLRPIEEDSEPSFGENISRAWHGWRDPGALAAREQARREAAKQYTADVLGLCLDHTMALKPETSGDLQAASREIYLSLRLSEPSHGTEHAVYTYLTTRGTRTLETFLTERFASLGDPAGKVLAETICDRLAPPEDVPSQAEGEIEEVDESEDDLP